MRKEKAKDEYDMNSVLKAVIVVFRSLSVVSSSSLSLLPI